jgi:hypothetical protein
MSKNPDMRYQPMRDDRASFIKSQQSMNDNQELDALGATARGDVFAEQKRRELEEEDDSLSSTVHVNQISRNPALQEKQYGYDNVRENYAPRAQSPYGYSNPAPSSRAGPQYRPQADAGQNPWQRGVGF